ncbi:helix-turn-helix domain-containing protein [Nguyenibacter vanlangensis]|uniref:Helix-turn-helix domain-containing protein n=1 Tax=Nguyenibacter vanlangensis TaxID=1216886 RepID=A0ABZ3D9S2_9PROT
MITARQIRAGRALLGWSQQQLADRAILSRNAVAKLERGEVDPRASTVEAVRRILEQHGVIFVPASGRIGEGVRAATPAE